VPVNNAERSKFNDTAKGLEKFTMSVFFDSNEFWHLLLKTRTAKMAGRGAEDGALKEMQCSIAATKVRVLGTHSQLRLAAHNGIC
jgi:hypothetical protein